MIDRAAVEKAVKEVVTLDKDWDRFELCVTMFTAGYRLGKGLPKEDTPYPTQTSFDLDPRDREAKGDPQC